MGRVHARQGSTTAVDLAHLASGFSLTWPGSETTSRVITAHRMRAFVGSVFRKARFTTAVEHALRVMVFNRLCDADSKLGVLRWL